MEMAIRILQKIILMTTTKDAWEDTVAAGKIWGGALGALLQKTLESAEEHQGDNSRSTP